MGKRIILTALNAKYIHLNPALYSLREYAGIYRDQIEICEFTVNWQVDDIIRELYRKKPDFLAFSCYIWNISQVLLIASALHKLRPDLPVWLGGPEVSWDCDSFLQEHPAITGIMCGEGEKTFLNLMRCYIDRLVPLQEIPGIVYREDGKILCGRDEGPDEQTDLDELPFLYTDPDIFENRILYYETSRGCPFSCSYCLSASEKHVRFRSLELVLDELQCFLDHRVRQVKFVDRTFNCSHERAVKIWEYLRDHDNGVTNFHFEIEAHLLREEEADLLCTLRPGLVQLEIGIQSANPATLQYVRRDPRITDVLERAERLIRKGNIHIHLDLIAGLPGEDLESFRRSFAAVYRIHPHELQLGFLKLLKGSPLYQEAREGRWGMIWRDDPPYEILQTAWLSFDDLLRLKDAEEMLEIYYNSQQFCHTIVLLEDRFPDPLSLYEALAGFWREQGAWNRPVSRPERLELLRIFAHRTDPSCSAQYDRALLTDLYQREKAKSRPSWAPDLGPFRQKIRMFYETEVREHRYTDTAREEKSSSLAHHSHLEPVLSGPSSELSDEPPEWMLFDYSRMDPVTGNARIVHIKL